jgi:DNA polymerase III beta subunit, C-terminal domain|nr:MAG TPA: beta clamp protein [Caudoviricetes sp.]
MNLAVNRKELLKAVQVLKSFVQKRKGIKYLNQIELETNEKCEFLLLKNQNLKTTVQIMLKADIKEFGSITVDYVQLENILKFQTSEIVFLESEEERLIISNGDKNKSILNRIIYTKPVNTLYDNLEETHIILEKNKFMDNLKKVSISASKEIENVAVHGVRIETTGEAINYVGTDTYRLSYLTNTFNSEKISLTLPLNIVNGLIKAEKLCAKDSLALSVENRIIRINLGNVIIQTEITDLQFPDYKTILENTNYNKKISLSTKEFKDVLKRVLNVCKSNKESKNGAIFNFRNNKVTITANNEQTSLEEEISTLQKGEEVRIHLNVKFLLEFVNTVKDKIIEIHLLNHTSSVLLNPENNNEYKYFTMPLALRD